MGPNYNQMGPLRGRQDCHKRKGRCDNGTEEQCKEGSCIKGCIGSPEAGKNQETDSLPEPDLEFHPV